MYLCNNCGKTFEQAAAITNDIGQTYGACPYCESEEFDISERCPFTGEMIPWGNGYAESVYLGVSADLDEIKAVLGAETKSMHGLFLEMLVRYVEERG